MNKKIWISTIDARENRAPMPCSLWIRQRHHIENKAKKESNKNTYNNLDGLKSKATIECSILHQ